MDRQQALEQFFAELSAWFDFEETDLEDDKAWLWFNGEYAVTIPREVYDALFDHNQAPKHDVY